MKTTIFGFLLVFASMQALAQNTAAEQEVIQLSKDKWQWMADKK